MDDTVTSAIYLQIEFGFVDSDARKVNYPNPSPGLTSDDVAELDSWIQQNQPIISSKSRASSTGINSAIKVESTKYKFDLG